MAGTKIVEFMLELPTAAAVSVAGTFNNWDVRRNPMRKGRDGIWRGRVSCRRAVTSIVSSRTGCGSATRRPQSQSPIRTAAGTLS